MKVYTLPDDITTIGKKSDSIIFHRYDAPVGSFQGKSMLSKHAISLVMSGEKTMHFAEKKVVIKDDEFHFLSRGNCLVTMKLSDKIPFKSILIFFDDKVLLDFHLKYAAKISRLKNSTTPTPEPYIAFKKDAFVLNFIHSLNLLLLNASSISSEMKQIKFEELMLHLLEKYPHQILAFQSSKRTDFNDFEIRRAVEINVTNNISLQDLAFLCNISLSTFKRRFEKIYGMPPNKWMVRKRMEIAKEFLLHDRQKPSEVYHQVGYANHSSFSQSFKQTFGATPKAFQEQQLNRKQ
ncbi:AraC family transcriptional regulator [Chryseolinea sp. H1M3-3]|uniref:helix-turn-helix domain-containing protein n=1 Tax=Chryseolinea sp. H1M3-3 TaxID=3034144 RepID=UPI0023ED1A08|nr:AraC family transcriptional regulator [Chryseolinea sp. H1M3-3]